MASVFSMIMNGDLPGRFVYRDDACAAFLTIEPITPGHTLVVPIEEVDHWIDLDPDTAAHLMQVAQRVGRAIQSELEPTRIGVIIAGMEVPHTHIHVLGIDSEADLDFGAADRSPDPVALDDIARRLAASIAG